MFLEVGANSNKGSVRTRNEDMILLGKEMIRDFSISEKISIPEKGRFIATVADGMGGHKRGDLASSIVSEDLSKFFYSLPEGLSFQDLESKFNEWIQNIHHRIVEKGQSNISYEGMGTTLVGLVIYESYILWINCGDSRIYRLRSRILSQLSQDHSLQALTRNKYAPSNVITNSIGGGEYVHLDIKNITDFVYTNDVFLLCSDGLSDTLGDDVIENEMNGGTLNGLVELALKARALDNVSACLIKIQL